MVKEAGLLFNVTVGLQCWGVDEHEPLIASLFLPVVVLDWKVLWTIRGG